MNGRPIDRNRAQTLLAAARLDALILFQPEHVSYAAGVHPGVAAQFRRAGAASALIPADPGLPLAAVLPDLAETAVRQGGISLDIAYHPLWVDTARVGPHALDEPLSQVLRPGVQPDRPETFDSRAAFGLLADQVRARGLSRGRLGADLGFVPASEFVLLREALPDAEIVDGAEALGRLQMVKTDSEIACLRAAAELSEAGLEAAMSRIAEGVPRSALSQCYTDGVRRAAATRGIVPTGMWDYISVGPDPWGAGEPARVHDIVKFDVGVVVSGYSSDMARTVCLGKPSRAAQELHAALLAGLESGLALLRPGVRLGDVHAAMLARVRSLGVPGYSRGHFGHGVGNDPFSEQWPFISADCDVLAEPGMVLSVEAPHYVEGLGGFIIEDQVLVTPAGIELMTTSPRGLRSF